MPELCSIHYPPILIGAQENDQDAFARHFPTHLEWLHENDVRFQVNGYRWPELLTHYLYATPVAGLICELTVRIAEEYAAAYRMFIGFTGDARG